MPRYLVLFSREPGREAAEKGFVRRDAADFFSLLAKDWWKAAASVSARLIVASPPEDRVAWKRCLGEERPHLWIPQRGTSFGQRLEGSARAAAALGGHAVIVGGDVVPSTQALEEAFVGLESGSDAVLAPAPDGGVSLVGIQAADLDLLGAIAPRRRNVFSVLHTRLVARGRCVSRVALAPDIDGPRGLRRQLASLASLASLRALARAALERGPRDRVESVESPPESWVSRPSPRGPPPPA